MTTPNCSKGSFKAYFSVRMRSQMKFLIVSFVLNFMSVILLSINTLIAVYNHAFDHDNPIYGLVILSGLAQLVLAFLGGQSAFDHCLKKDNTDTFYSLPVTRGEMFWADLLSGYISHVATLIPCSVASIIMARSAGYYYGMPSNEQGNSIFNLFIELNLALFFSYTFAYLISVIVTVSCGKKISSIAYTLIGSGLIYIATMTVSSYFISCRMGSGYYNTVGINNSLLFGTYYTNQIDNYAPPLGTFFKTAYNAILSVRSVGMGNKTYASVDPTPYIVYIPIIAALIASAYFIFKHRKPENTGNGVAVKVFYYAFSGFAAFIVICMCFYYTYSAHLPWLSALIAVIAGGIVLLIFTLAGRSKKPDIPKHLIRSASIIAGCIALFIIVDKTGVFGTRYYNISPSKTKGIEVTINDYRQTNRVYEELHFREDADIEQFISSYNETLKEHFDDMEYGTNIIVKFNLDGGKNITRSFSDADSIIDGSDGISKLYAIVRSLPGYPEALESAAIGSIQYNATVSATMFDRFGTVEIPSERFKDLRHILFYEISEKYDINSKEIGRMVVENSDQSLICALPIRECFTNTISFIESFRDNGGDAEALSITYFGEPRLRVSIKIRHLEQSAVKELFSLLKVTEDGQNHNGGNRFSISSTNGLSYYVPDENKERVLDLMLTIIETNASELLSQM